MILKSKKNSKNLQTTLILSDCNWIRTHNHLVDKQTLDHLAKLTFLND